jgi:hypothetical protein
MHVKTDEGEGLAMKADTSLVRNSFLYDCTQPYAGPLLLMTALVCALKASQPDLHPNISLDMYLLRPRSGIGVPHLERGPIQVPFSFSTIAWYTIFRPGLP